MKNNPRNAAILPDPASSPLRKTQLLALIALFVTALYLLIIASNQSEPTLTLVGDLSFVIVSLCAFLATLLVWKKIPHSFT